MIELVKALQVGFWPAEELIKFLNVIACAIIDINMSNADLRKANKAKKDEFYTQLTDIEKELRHYRDFFEGKTVFCNADDPYESNFFKYFAMNFKTLGLKKLIATN